MEYPSSCNAQKEVVEIQLQKHHIMDFAEPEKEDHYLQNIEYGMPAHSSFIRQIPND